MHWLRLIQAALEPVTTSVDSPDSLEPEVSALAPEASAVTQDIKADEPTVESKNSLSMTLNFLEFNEEDALAEADTQAALEPVTTSVDSQIALSLKSAR